MGPIVEDVLNDGGYDTDTVNDDLQDKNDSAIIEYIQKEASNLEWTPKNEQILFKTLNDIFIHRITDYQQLISGLTAINDDDDDSKDIILTPSITTPSKPITKQLIHLNNNELVNIVVYIINTLHQNPDDESQHLYLYKQYIINHILQQKWNGSFDFEHNNQFEDTIYQNSGHIMSQTALQRLRRAINSFDMTLFEGIEMKEYKITPIQIMSEHKQEAINIRKHLTKEEQDEILDTMDNMRFQEMIESAIHITNAQINKSFTQIDSKRVIQHFKKNINPQIFKSFTKKTFSDDLQRLMEMGRGASAKLYKHIRESIKRRLIHLNDDEFYIVVGYAINKYNLGMKKSTFTVMDAEDIIDYMKRIKLNGKQFTQPFKKKHFHNLLKEKLKKGPANTLFKWIKEYEAFNIPQQQQEERRICIKEEEKKEEMIEIIEYEEKKEEKKEERISCVRLWKDEWKELNVLQIRYALLYVLMRFNAGFKDKKHKQISDIDGVISFLCSTRKFDGNMLCSIGVASFAYLLYDFIGVKHCPSKKVIESLLAYDFDALPISDLDLSLPFIFKDAIDQQIDSGVLQLKEGDLCSILFSIEFKKYCFIREPKRKLVELFTEYKCKLKKGKIFKLSKCVSSCINNGDYKIKCYQLLNCEKIFEIMAKHCDIRDCDCVEFEEIVGICCLWYNLDHKELMRALNRKTLIECNNEELMLVIDKCIDQLILKGIIRDGSNSLYRKENKDKVLNYVKQSNLNGNDVINFTKKSKFAIHIFEGAKFSKEQIGIKTKLMKVYTEMKTNFDYNELSVESINGSQFMNRFKSKHEFVECIRMNAPILNDLYESISAFFKLISTRNNCEFHNLLHLFINKKYGITVNIKHNELTKLNGKMFVNDIGHKAFCNVLIESKTFNINKLEHAIMIYDDLMDLNLRLKGIKSINKCNNNELMYLMRKYIIKRFNRINHQNVLNTNTIIQFLQCNKHINGTNFNNENRKSIAKELTHFDKGFKTGPIRKLCADINQYCNILQY